MADLLICRWSAVCAWRDRFFVTARMLYLIFVRLTGWITLLRARRRRDPRLIDGVDEITATMAARLDDGASAAEVLPLIREMARRWLEGQVRAGALPAAAGGQLDELARAVFDRRYGLGPLSAQLRDPQVENVDVNGWDEKLMNSPTARAPCPWAGL